MRNNRKIDLLIAGCITLVILLVAIQAYLVRNTYHLTRDKYVAGVKSALTRASKTAQAIAWENRISDSLKACADLYARGKISKATFLNFAGKKISPLSAEADRYYNRVIRDSLHLEEVSYMAAYREIIIELNGHRDILLSVKDEPFTYIGAKAGSGHRLFLNREQERTGSHERTKNGTTGIETSLYLNTITNHYTDIDGWRQRVIWQMAGVLALASGLILAVILLFYLVFRALFRQKKLAEIRTDLSNNLAHELKTPLSSAGLILKSLERPETQADPVLFKELLASMHRQQAKLQRIVDMVLDDALGTVNPPEMRPTDIAAFLNTYAQTIQASDHRWNIAVTPATQPLLTDTIILEKVLDNLLDNAFQYTPATSTIRLEGFYQKTNYLIRVSDNGPGIAEPFRSQVFEKFYRVPEQNRHSVKGLGLGLHIARQAVQAIGGSLTLECPDIGGCIFTIRLPQNPAL